MPLTPNLIAHWKFNEASGNAIDSHGSVTLTQNGTMSSTAGKIGTSRATASISDYFATSSSTVDVQGISFALAGWFFLDFTGQTQNIIYKSDFDTNNNFMIRCFPDVTETYKVHFTVGTQTVTHPTTLSAGTWYFVAVYFNATGTQLGISLNGSGFTTATGGGGVTSHQVMYFCTGIADPETQPYRGRVDSWSMWKNRILDTTDVAELWNGGSGLDYPFPSVETITDSTLLFLLGFDVVSSTTCPLVITGHESVNSNITLFTNGLPANNAPLYIYGHDAVTSPTCPLVISGISAINNNITLFIIGSPENTAPLYIYGHDAVNDNITLYIAGKELINNQTTLYIYSVQQTALSLPLSLIVVEPGTITDSAPLFIAGADEEGVGAYSTLYISGTAMDRVLPLFLLGHPFDQTVRSMGLWIEGTNQVTPDSIPLFLKNTQEEVYDSMTLFVKTTTGTPIAEDLFLFLKRPFEGAVDLYMHGPGTELIAPSLPLVIHNGVTIDDNVTLVVPTTFDAHNKKTTLYTHGW
jgi:hypothetical protein